MSPTDLCQLPPEPAGGCCDPQTAPAAVPLSIENPAGLSAIGYRIGTFTSFRRTMLDRVTGAGGVATSPPVPAPFANWHEGADGDYQTIFIELWAYLTDILTFYQERIANEAYIGTATQSDSSRLLAQLVDYRPSPGAGATGLVAFTVATNRVVAVPQGFRVASRASARTSSCGLRNIVAIDRTRRARRDPTFDRCADQSIRTALQLRPGILRAGPADRRSGDGIISRFGRHFYQDLACS